MRRFHASSFGWYTHREPTQEQRETRLQELRRKANENLTLNNIRRANTITVRAR